MLGCEPHGAQAPDSERARCHVPVTTANIFCGERSVC